MPISCYPKYELLDPLLTKLNRILAKLSLMLARLNLILVKLIISTMEPIASLQISVHQLRYDSTISALSQSRTDSSLVFLTP